MVQFIRGNSGVIMLWLALVLGCKREPDNARLGSTDDCSAPEPQPTSADCRSRQASRTACYPPLLMVAGDGVGRHCLGDSPGKAPSSSCDSAGDRTVCRTLVSAMERVYISDSLSSIRVHRGGRSVPASFRAKGDTFGSGKYRTAEHVEPGMPIKDALAKLGTPRFVESWLDPEFGPVTRYGFDGIELQTETASGLEIIGAIEVKLGVAKARP